MKLVPVVIFAFNRPKHLKLTLEALSRNSLAAKTSLKIFIDGPRDDQDSALVEESLTVAKSVLGFKDVSVIARNTNCGLAGSVIEGVSKVLESHPAVIVLEDDLVTSPSFLTYMNSALHKYQSEERVMSISGYGRPGVRDRLTAPEKYDAYFVPRNSSWGWGTWAESWSQADWDLPDFGQFIRDRNQREKFAAAGDDVCLMLELQQHGLLDSWAIRWTYTHFLNNAVSLVPYVSYVDNIGFDGSGTHCRKGASRLRADVNLAKDDPALPEEIVVRPDALDAFRKAHHQRLASKVYWRMRLIARGLGKSPVLS